MSRFRARLGGRPLSLSPRQAPPGIGEREGASQTSAGRGRIAVEFEGPTWQGRRIVRLHMAGSQDAGGGAVVPAGSTSVRTRSSGGNGSPVSQPNRGCTSRSSGLGFLPATVDDYALMAGRFPLFPRLLLGGSFPDCAGPPTSVPASDEAGCLDGNRDSDRGLASPACSWSGYFVRGRDWACH